MSAILFLPASNTKKINARFIAARSILELHFRNCEFADIEESIAELRQLPSDLPAAKKGLRVV